jgi:hypothetical protein
LNVGFLRTKTMGVGLNVTPALASWLRPRFAFAGRSSFNRDPNNQQPVRLEGDSAGAYRLPESLSNSQHGEIGATISLGQLAQGVFGDSSFVSSLFRRIQPIDASLTRDYRSGFDRPIFDASLAYQLGLGGLDAFRAQGGVPATSAGSSRGRTVAGGLQLPLGLTMRLSYRDQQNTSWTLRTWEAEQVRFDQQTREWPSGSLSWTYSPRWALRKVISILTANARLTRSFSFSEQPGLAGGEPSRTENTARTVAPSVSLTWFGGVITSMQYSHATSDALTSGNTTRRDQEDWSGAMNFGFRLPRSLIRMRNDIRTTLSVNSSVVATCLLRAGTTECSPVSDSRRRAVDLRLDTGFSPQVRGGASFSYVLTEQRQTAARYSQLTVTVFAEIFFLSGQIR